MAVGPLFEARYDGFCADCGDDFCIGDLIAGSDDGWLCELCAEAWRQEDRDVGDLLA